jgi:hypothetical protein
VSQTQTGDRNYAQARRLRGFETLEITQTQTGDDNRAVINENGSGQVYPGVFLQEQIGNSNYASIYRTGGSIGGDHTQIQHGNDNISEIGSKRETLLAETKQFGDLNEAYIIQNTAGNSASIMQDGNSNMATITQGQ